MKTTPFIVLFLGTLAVACAAEGTDSDTASDDVTAQAKVAGFDLEGFRIANLPAGPQVCPAVVSEVQAACGAAGGVTSRTDGCQSLCSLPVARSGQAAGFDFDGFKIGEKPAPGTFCPAVVNPAQEACGAAGGRASAIDGCAYVCSVPIAPTGKVAGYAFTGPVTINAIGDNDSCPRVITQEETACRAIEGAKVIRGERCRTLCSAPIAR